MKVDRNWAYVPTSALPDTRAFTELAELTVDGETFIVRKSEPDGAFHYDWISGPNDGYGFSTSGRSTPVSNEHHKAAIRDFLSAVDPATGYLS